MSRTRRLRVEALEERTVLTGTLSIGDAGAAEGTATCGWVEIEFPITYSGETVDGGFTVGWAVVLNGTADSNDIPVAYRTGTVTFAGLDVPGGETQNAVTRVWSDNVVELEETFQLELRNISVGGITFSDSLADGTITDDDLAEIQVHIKGTGDYVQLYSLDHAEGNAGPTNQTWYVNFYLTNRVQANVSLDYSFSDQWATQGTDYTVSPASGTVTFNDGDEGYPDGFTPIAVTFIGDDIVERDEIFTLLLENFNNQGRAATLVDNSIPFKIENDETATVNIMSSTYPNALEKVEGNPGDTAPTLDFIVFVDKAVDTSFTVDVKTSSGTATAGEDFVVKVETITFSGGTASESHTFTVTGKVDTKLELDEDFDAVIVNNVQASGRAVVVSFVPNASATILNDDLQSKVSISGGSVTEGDSATSLLAFTLTLSQAVDHDVVVTVTIWGITATATQGSEQDFIPPQNDQVTVTIPAGQPSASFNISVKGDTRDESNETIRAFIASIDAGDFDVIADPQHDEATGTITDDDP